MTKKIAVIGAGIAGLSAASYLQRNGYETEIYELHSIPGGLCTSWNRKGYTFDGCINWLVGSSSSNPYYDSWNELLDMESLTFIEADYFVRIDDENGKSLTLYSDADRLCAEFKKHAESHHEIIDELGGDIKLCAKNDVGLDEHKAAAFGKWSQMSYEQFARKLESPFLENTLKAFFGNGSMIGLLFILSCFHQKSAGYPIGGSLKFARAIEKRYLELGGKISYNSRVIKVLTKNGRAYGLKLDNGREMTSDIVISASDGYNTIFNLLDGKYLNDTISGFYDEKNPRLNPYSSWVQISLGVNKDLKNQPHFVAFKVKNPLVIDVNASYDMVNAHIYNFDPTLAPSGSTIIIGIFNTGNYKYWQDLRSGNFQKYEMEKKRIAGEFIDRIDVKLGNIKEHVEVIDVSTPATVIRYTNNWHGSYMGWGWGTDVPVGIQRELPGLEGFYMTGQWITPSGGLPPALMGGKSLAMQICQKDGKDFNPNFVQ